MLGLQKEVRLLTQKDAATSKQLKALEAQVGAVLNGLGKAITVPVYAPVVSASFCATNTVGVN